MTQNKSRNNPFTAHSPKSFITPTWQQHADMISHLGQFSQNILLVIAPPGGGKTTFLEHFLSNPTPGLRNCAVSANEDSLEDLMKAIMAGFELPWMGLHEAYDQIQDHVEDAYVKEETTWMLLIDDAHLLDDDKLKSLLELIQFHDDPKKQLHLVFLGEPSLELRLFSPDIASCIHGKIYTIELEPWTLNDIKTFFAKDAHLPRLNTEQLTQIFEHSRGLPESVLRERESLLSQGQPKARKTRDLSAAAMLKKWQNRPIIVGVMVGLVIGGGYLMLNGALEEESAAIPGNLAQLDNDWEMQHMTPEQSPQAAYQFENMNAKEVAAFDESDGFSQTNKTPAHSAMSTSQMQDQSEQAELEEPKKSDHQAKAQSPVVAQKTVLEQSTSPKKLVPAVAKQTPVKKQSQTIMAKSLKHQPAVSEKNRKLTAEEEHLLSVADDHYTLQLLGARSEDSVKQFIQAHDIAECTHYFKTKLSGKDWYVVVYGDYYSKEEALSAIDSMPASLRDQSAQPWVRELKSIQKDIRK